VNKLIVHCEQKAEGKAMQKHEYLIKYLHEQLVLEYQALFNYLYHSARIQDREIRKAFEDFSRNELEHARMLIMYILNKEGNPVFIMPEVNQEQDEVKMLVLSMAAEESAVKKYTMIQQLIDDPSDKEMFGRTIDVERKIMEY
jgi:rubrerythrin